MQVNTGILQGMIKNVADPGLRALYGGIISGKYPYKVYCLNPGKDVKTGRPMHPGKVVIGFIDRRGGVIDKQIISKSSGEPVAGIASSRDRLDGRKGFKCYCGNSSIRAEEEARVIGTEKQVPRFTRPPTREEIGGIYQELQKSGKGPLHFEAGYTEYDGFGLEEVKT